MHVCGKKLIVNKTKRGDNRLYFCSTVSLSLFQVREKLGKTDIKKCIERLL